MYAVVTVFYFYFHNFVQISSISPLPFLPQPQVISLKCEYSLLMIDFFLFFFYCSPTSMILGGNTNKRSNISILIEQEILDKRQIL